MYQDLLVQHTPRQGDADIYGLIYFSDKHPNVKKVLGDSDFWSALDAWSGPRWAVFAMKFHDDSVASLTKESLPPDAILHFMVQPIMTATSKTSSAPKYKPELTVFAFDTEGELLRRTMFIDDSTQDAVVRSLKDSMEVIANALERIDDTNLYNTYGVMAAVNLALDHDRNWKRVKRAAKAVLGLREIIMGARR